MDSKAPLYTFIPLPLFPRAKVNNIFAWSTKAAWPHNSSWEHRLNASLTYHSTGSSVRLQGGVHVPYYRCVKPRWTSLNSVDWMRQNRSQHINKTLHLTLFFFSPHKVPSIIFKMIHFYWEYSSVLTVWKSGTAFSSVQIQSALLEKHCQNHLLRMKMEKNMPVLIFFFILFWLFSRALSFFQE